MATGSQVDLVHCHPKDLELTDIELGESSYSKKPPRRIIHFSDGIVEEYSTDEETGDTTPLVPRPPKDFDPHSMDILPYIWFYLSLAFTKSYDVAENVGERICWILGITSPKYASAINEYYKIQLEEEMEKKRVEGQDKF